MIGFLATVTPLGAMALVFVPVVIFARAVSGFGSFPVLMRSDYMSMLLCGLMAWAAAYLATGGDRGGDSDECELGRADPGVHCREFVLRGLGCVEHQDDCSGSGSEPRRDWRLQDARRRCSGLRCRISRAR